ncbi:HU family DNA-binding protein [Spirochaeta thermophila]|uniref:DNA-binding protein HbbU n=1 Tax=Winmispira thermophila (strain ATCC 49972 / DSM 6192 / RI 19.B1) TaxID=665571 RepID=E0RPL0_WINT6|nr:HU family DNA-binding protein [Spirochaeta thermophila]ADN02792.1 DNA-binding protein HbbU [Spirochaeta thermophila DSM 6192]
MARKTEKLTKAQIVENISQHCDLSKKDIQFVIDSFFSEVKRALVEGKTVELRGFGTFEIRVRKGRDRARNPKTGEIVKVEDHGVAVFRPGKELKDSVWNVRM